MTSPTRTAWAKTAPGRGDGMNSTSRAFGRAHAAASETPDRSRSKPDRMSGRVRVGSSCARRGRPARARVFGIRLPLRRPANGFSFPCVTREGPGMRLARQTRPDPITLSPSSCFLLPSQMADAQSDLLRSSLDLLILKALSWGPMHGYGISEWIDGASESGLLLGEGTLYPALPRPGRGP